MLTRRSFVGAAVTFPATASLLARAPHADAFLWGAATAGHQIEGNNVNADVWLLEQLKPTPFAEPSGDACDSLHRWREDVDLVASLNLNCYRFSVEWSRIEPAQGQFSTAFLDHYARMVAYCRDRGIAPIVTLSHFTSPCWFAAAGGWLNPEAPKLFARFAEQVAKRMGDGISHILTFNEPNLQKLGSWSHNPPGTGFHETLALLLAEAKRVTGSDKFAVLNTGDADLVIEPVLVGHRAARDAIRSVRSQLPVGMTLAIPDDQAVGNDSRVEAKRMAVYKPFLDEARRDDFIGVQTYGRALIGPRGGLPPPKGAELTQTGEEFYPRAIGAAIRYAHQETGRPVMVTENGLATTDDRQRARFIPEAIAAVDSARTAGVPVIGYLHWSLLDNFEWFAGYGPRFGLVAVNRKTFVRTPKPSARLYASIVAQRRGL